MCAVMCALLLGAGGCARFAPAVLLSTTPDAQACVTRFVASDAAIARAGTTDAQAWRVPGFPYLRVDRVTASLLDVVVDGAGRRAWLLRAAALDEQGRDVELNNSATTAAAPALAGCRARLLATLEHDDTGWNALRAAAARVPDDYSQWRRVVGLYPLSAGLVLGGVTRMQAHEMPHLDLATSGADANVTTYALAPTAPAQRIVLAALTIDALGLPQPGAAGLLSLLHAYAPQLSIDLHDVNDRLGLITRTPAGVAVDSAQPVLYADLAWTRFGDDRLLQLVYTWWYPARPARTPWDGLSGRLDGLTWRVTLDRDGEPLLYDVMHNCGCYHMFLPTPRLQPRAQSASLAEPPWIPFTVPAAWQGRVRLVLAPASHYLTAVAPALAATSARSYELRDYAALRSLPNGSNGYASLFDADGLVPDTRRAERWLLWPLGIVAPGSMRQWGHHATAFVGRRHFDEARLFERYFVRADSSSGAGATCAD